MQACLAAEFNQSRTYIRLLPNQTSKEKTHSIQKGQLLDCLPFYLLHLPYHLTHNLFCSLLSVLPIRSTSIHSFPLLHVCLSISTLLHIQAHEHTPHPTHTTNPALLPPQPAAHGRKGGRSMAKATLKPLAKALLSRLQNSSATQDLQGT